MFDIQAPQARFKPAGCNAQKQEQEPSGPLHGKARHRPPQQTVLFAKSKYLLKPE